MKFKKEKQAGISRKIAAYLEMFVMITAVFAFAFVMNAGVAGAAGAQFELASGVTSKDVSGLVKTFGGTDAEAAQAVSNLGATPAATGTPTAAPSWTLSNSFTLAENVIVSAAWAVAAYYAVVGISDLFGWDETANEELLTNAVAMGIAAATFVGTFLTSSSVYTAGVGTTASAFVSTATTGTTLGIGGTGLTSGSAGFWASFVSGGVGGGATGAVGFLGVTPFGWIVIGTAVVVALTTYLLSETEEYKTETVYFKCYAWQAPRGGADCDKCNEDDEVPCSEYRCKSLGQGCGLVNEGTINEKCIWKNSRDVSSPGINTWREILTAGHEYSEVKPRPEGGSSGGTFGFKIVKAGGSCLNAFTAVEFGIRTTEDAQCKIDTKHTKNYDEMAYYLGNDNIYKKEHKQKVSMPGTKLLNSLYPELNSDGKYTFYVRCMDGNGNKNADEFAVSFCVDSGPDLTAPLIKQTNPKNDAPVQHNVDNITVEVYTNEPAECSWSRNDADYDSMTNQMICGSGIWMMNSDMLYTCLTALTGIKNNQDNKFYFRCKDLSNNTMHQSYTYTLKGTQPLTILKTNPNGTIGGSTTTVSLNLTVETDDGYKNGEAACYLSTTGKNGSYDVMFFDTGKNIHNQPLDLAAGSYKYYVKCVDLGGNADYSQTSFKVVVDTSMPSVVRAYNENDKIKIVTDEDTSCSYSTQSCNFDFDDGLGMTGDEAKEHYAEWKAGQTYFIKCSDKYGNLPDPSECSIIVRPSTR